jgi:putative ABC transport system permease protein
VRWLEAARAVVWRVRARLTRRHREAELEEEIQAHVDLLTQEHQRRGLNEVDARFAALRDFGGAEQVREACRDLRRAPVFDSVAADVRYAWRSLRRQPAFAGAAIATFALGIGASTAMYTVMHEAVLAPLPYTNARGLVWIADAWPEALGVAMNVEYLVWQQQSRSFSRMAAYSTRRMTMTGAGNAERLLVGTVSPQFFAMLGVVPALGRAFLSEEGEAGREHVVLLSDPLWRGRFGSDASVIGRTVILDGEAYLVVGVLPRALRFLEHEQPAVYAPYVLPSTRQGSALWISPVNAIGWLRPGVTAAAAAAELAAILQRSKGQYPLSFLSYSGEYRPQPRVVTPGEWRRSQVGPALFVLAAAVGVLLLIACANVANLQLARFLERQRELAVRAALGADRLRLVRQLATESLVLAGLGGLVAVAFAHAALRVATALAPERLDFLRDVQLNPAALAFASLVVVLAGVTAGALPALVSTPISGSEPLQKGTPRHTQGRAARRWAAAFSAFTLGLAVVLLVGSGLLGQSFARLTALHYGFQPTNVLALRVGLPAAAYGDRVTIRAAADRLLSELGTLPGAATSGLSDVGPLGSCGGYPAEIEGLTGAGQRPSFCEHSVSPHYLSLLGAEVLHGRLFDEGEGRGTAAVAVINESARRQFFDGRNPIGARLRTRDEWLTIIGVVADLRASRSDPGSRPALFQPFEQPDSTLMNGARMIEWTRAHPSQGSMAPGVTELTVVLRSQPGIRPGDLAGAVRAQVTRFDPNVAVYDVATMEERLASTVAADRFLMVLLAALAAVALGLALVGVYGVTSYGVARRTAEIGVRLALGASRVSVLGLVLGQTARAAVIAVALGVLSSLALGRFVRALLYETSPGDPVTVAGAATLGLAVALLAAFVPARRATTVDPAVTLRHE